MHAPPPVRLVVFDFDGTLADSFDWFVGAVNEAADRFGFRRLAVPEIAELRLHGARHFMRHVGLAPIRVPQVARWMRARMTADIARIRRVEGVERTFASLAHGGIGRAIVTSNARTNVERVLGPDNTALVGHWATGTALFGKAAQIRRVVRAAGVRPDAALYVGDETRDAEAAHRAGLRFVGVGWGYASPAVLAPLSDLPLLGRLEDLLAHALPGDRDCRVPAGAP
jgi:phosphoglycolate phosphatase